MKNRLGPIPECLARLKIDSGRFLNFWPRTRQWHLKTRTLKKQVQELHKVELKVDQLIYSWLLDFSAKSFTQLGARAQKVPLRGDLYGKPFKQELVEFWANIFYFPRGEKEVQFEEKFVEGLNVVPTTRMIPGAAAADDLPVTKRVDGARQLVARQGTRQLRVACT